MSDQTGHRIQEAPSFTGDLWGGLAAMLVALPSSVAFGILVYTALGPEYAGQGAMAGMLGAAALGMVAPLCGRTAGLISAPCAPAAAVLSAFIAGLPAANHGMALDPAAILPLMALTALLAAGLQILSRLIAWVPIRALAGILLVIAWRMFDRNMFRLLRHPAGRLDFAFIAGVILVALTVDLIAASGVGVGLAILLFIRDQIRGAVIRRKRYLNQVSSKTRRQDAEQRILNRCGEQGVFCELQGNLFFGTTDQLFSQLEPDLATKRYLLPDMRRVQSIDYTAAHLFEQMPNWRNGAGSSCSAACLRACWKSGTLNATWRRWGLSGRGMVS